MSDGNDYVRTKNMHKHEIKILYIMHSVGFEPTSTNTVQLECTPLDHSGTNADLYNKNNTSVTFYIVVFWSHLYVSKTKFMTRHNTHYCVLYLKIIFNCQE